MMTKIWMIICDTISDKPRNRLILFFYQKHLIKNKHCIHRNTEKGKTMDAEMLASFANWVADHALGIVVFIGLFVEITPIKVSPISSLMSIIFNPVNRRIDQLRTELKGDINNVKSELKTDIDDIKDRQEKQELSTKEMIKSIEYSEISRIRWDIIEFSNSIDNGQLHTRDEYRHILDDGNKYHDLIEKYHLRNGVVDEELTKIRTHYLNEKDRTTSVYF